MNTAKKVCHFHVGRGGQFYNPNFLSFKGFKDINSVGIERNVYTYRENYFKVKKQLIETLGKAIWQAKIDGQTLEDIFCEFANETDLNRIVEVFGDEIAEDLGELMYFDNSHPLGIYLDNDGTGRFNFDNEFDTEICIFLEDCEEYECRLILDSGYILDDEKSYILEKYPQLETINQ